MGTQEKEDMRKKAEELRLERNDQSANLEAAVSNPHSIAARQALMLLGVNVTVAEEMREALEIALRVWFNNLLNVRAAYAGEASATRFEFPKLRHGAYPQAVTAAVNLFVQRCQKAMQSFLQACRPAIGSIVQGLSPVVAQMVADNQFAAGSPLVVPFAESTEARNAKLQSCVEQGIREAGISALRELHPEPRPGVVPVREQDREARLREVFERDAPQMVATRVRDVTRPLPQYESAFESKVREGFKSVSGTVANALGSLCREIAEGYRALEASLGRMGFAARSSDMGALLLREKLDSSFQSSPQCVPFPVNDE